MNLVDWEISTQSTVFESFELLMMMLKRRLHGKIYLNETEKFLNEVYTVALQLIRVSICSFDHFKKRQLETA